MVETKSCKYKREKKHFTEKTNYYCVIRGKAARCKPEKEYLCKDYSGKIPNYEETTLTNLQGMRY